MNKALPYLVMLLCLMLHGDMNAQANSMLPPGEEPTIRTAILYWERPDQSYSINNSITDPFVFDKTQYNRDKTRTKSVYQTNKHTSNNSNYTEIKKKTFRSLATGSTNTKRDNFLARLPNNINTPYGEMAPFRYADKLYFSTVIEENYLPTKSKDKRFVKHPVTRIFESKHNGTATSSDANPRSAILHATNVTLTADAKRMYFTLCTDEIHNSQEKCTIWYRKRTYEGEWTPAIKLPDHINLRNYTATQPSVGYDWQSKKEILFFASNRPGGKGGLDIWYAEINRDGSFGKPRSLPFNTAFDEITPYFHQPTQMLFFSTNGMTGKGGFDIYQTQKTDKLSWKAPQNIGPYVNTTQNELYYTYHSGSGFAYFVSSKPGSAFADADIMEARVFTDCQLQFFDNSNKKPLSAIAIEVKNLNTGDSNDLYSGIFTHKANLELETGVTYRMTVKSAGFLPYSFEITTDEVGFIDKIEKNIFLTPFVRP